MLYPPPPKRSIVRAKHSVVSVMHHFSVVGRSRSKDLLPRGQHLVVFFMTMSVVPCSFVGGRRCQQILKPLLPLKLKQSCRITIRRQFKSNIISNIAILPLPRQLIDYLIHGDAMACSVVRKSRKLQNSQNATGGVGPEEVSPEMEFPFERLTWLNDILCGPLSNFQRHRRSCSMWDRWQVFTQRLPHRFLKFFTHIWMKVVGVKISFENVFVCTTRAGTMP